VGLLVLNDMQLPLVEPIARALDAQMADGTNLRYSVHNAGGDLDRLTDDAEQLVADGAEVIVAISTPSAQAARRATDGTETVVVFAFVNDPISAGLVEDLARPGGHVTGIASLGGVLAGKAVEVLARTDPTLSRVLLVASDQPGFHQTVDEYEQAADDLGLSIDTLIVHDTGDVGDALRRVDPSNFDALIVPFDPVILNAKQAITEFCRMGHLPSISFENVSFTTMTLSTDPKAHAEQAATLIAKVLGGISPPDLPVEPPGRFALRVFAKRAAAVGYQVTPALLELADEVVEE